MTRILDRRRAARVSAIAGNGLQQILPGVLALALASCSGGGGGGGGGGSGLLNNPSASYLQQAAEPTSPFNAADWSSSQEYANSTGLAQLKAAEGYARRSGGLSGGQGVRIAIIDSGIDLTHPDLGNLLGQSWSAGGEGLVGDSHGTFVAGIAGASRTQSGGANDMHGMAYRATLVNFQAARPSVTAANGGVSFSTADLVEAVHTASGMVGGMAGVESDILNLSLGAFSSSDSTFGNLRAAMRNAAAKDKIMVLAAGNEGLSADPSRKLQPIYPAAYADDVGIAGHAIVVGNLTSGNQAAASSNLCGDARDYCLFAPGASIRSTLDGGGYGVGSGTSFAAPYVAGAAAVVKAAFPGVSNQDVVNRLLLTATDLGAAGVDETFGRGLLDMEAAMNPVSPLGLPIGSSVTGETSAIEETVLHLGQAWSMDDEGRRLLGKAVGFDEMGFPFPVDLADRVRSPEPRSGLADFIGSQRRSSANLSHETTSLGVSIAEPANTPAFTRDGFQDDKVFKDESAPFLERQRAERSEPELAFSADLSPRATLFATLNGSSRTRAGLQQDLERLHGDLFRPGMTLAPFDQLSGEVSGGGLALRPYDGLEFALSAFASTDDEQGAGTAQQKLEIARTFADRLAVRLGLGLLQEEGGFLGARTAGAFGTEMDSRSTFAELSLLAAFSDRVHWFGVYSHGRSSIAGGEGGLLDDWSSAQASAFATGLAFHDLSTNGDSLTLTLSQPLRGERAQATLTAPVGRTPEGAVVTERRRIDLEPSSREVVSEAAYRWSFGRDQAHEIKTGGFARFNPGHDADRPPEFGLGLHYRLAF